MSFVRCLESSKSGKTYSHRELHNLSPDDAAPLLVRYDLKEASRKLDRKDLPGRAANMWRYAEVLPADGRDDIVTLGEGLTPLIPVPDLGTRLGLQRLYVKDEGANPTGSFKARGISAAVTMARQLGARKLCIPTAGNAGGALAAYAARAGLQAAVFMPDDTPLANQVEVSIHGAEAVLVPGVITDAAQRMSSRLQEGWFDISTLKEPYRIEGKKTMGYEIAEQMDWKLPDVILYPTGGGTGLIGMWKAFDEMEEMGWIGSSRPRMVSVQAEGCAPIVRAFQRGDEYAEPWKNPSTLSSGLRVPKAVGDFLMLRTLRESRGTAVAVSDRESFDSIRVVGRTEGIFLCPESGACFAALKKLIETGWLDPSESIVVFNTGTGLKYIDTLNSL